MDLVLHTQRLVLQPLQMEDVDLALEIFTDPEAAKYIGGTETPEQIRAGMSTWVRRGGDGCIGIWCIRDRHSSEKLGDIFLLPMPIDFDDTDYSQIVPDRMPDGDVEIGYNFKRSVWGNGYATEACKRMLEFAFTQTELKEVVASFYEENLATIRVLEKSGFKDCGLRRCYAEDDCPDYRITREEWIEQSAIQR